MLIPYKNYDTFATMYYISTLTPTTTKNSTPHTGWIFNHFYEFQNANLAHLQWNSYKGRDAQTKPMQAIQQTLNFE